MVVKLTKDEVQQALLLWVKEAMRCHSGPGDFDSAVDQQWEINWMALDEDGIEAELYTTPVAEEEE